MPFDESLKATITRCELAPRFDLDKLIFTDETGASTKMARLYGRAERGRRCRAPIPHGHWLTMTFTSALRRTALTAPITLDGLLNAGAFLAYVEQVLAPTLDLGDIVVMDNLSGAQRHRRSRRYRGSGRKSCPTTAHSPDFNPIENAYARFKSRLRKAAARNVEALQAAIANAFHSFTPQECANFFIAAGYGSA
jgi:transposase